MLFLEIYQLPTSIEKCSLFYKTTTFRKRGLKHRILHLYRWYNTSWIWINGIYTLPVSDSHLLPDPDYSAKAITEELLGEKLTPQERILTFFDILCRLTFVNKWIHYGIPNVIWLPGIFNVRAFFTSILYNYSSYRGICIKDTDFYCQVTRFHDGTLSTDEWLNYQQVRIFINSFDKNFRFTLWLTHILTKDYWFSIRICIFRH